MMGTNPDTDEVMQLKWKDFDKNAVIIRGARARTITFSEEEMKYLRKLRSFSHASDYVLASNSRQADLKSKPLKRWAVWDRMTTVAQKLGVEKRVLSEQNIRLSGQLNWISQRLIREYGTTNVSSNQINSVIYDSILHFGTTKEEFNKLAPTSRSGRISRIKQNYRQYEKSINRK